MTLDRVFFFSKHKSKIMIEFMRLIFLNSIFYFTAIFCAASIARAQSASSLATGGSGRATVEAGDVIFLNPASLVHLRGRYFYSAASSVQKQFSVALSDSTRDSLFAGGLAYSQSKDEKDARFSNVSISVADFIVNKWTIGITGHQYIYQTSPQTTYNTHNLDVGLMYTPTPNVGFGLVGSNLFSLSKNLPVDFPAKRSYGLGANWIYRSLLRVRADLVLQDHYNYASTVEGAAAPLVSESPSPGQDLIMMTGLESFMNSWAITRIGYQLNNTRNLQYASLGFGFRGPKFALNYAWVTEINGNQNQTHSIDLQVPF